MPIDASEWREHVVSAELQALFDVAASESATVSVRISREPTATLVTAMGRAAIDEGFAFASVSLGEEHSLHGLDFVVRALANGLRSEGVAERRSGILAMLDAFAEKHGKRASDRFEERAEEAGLTGDLHVLARGYVASATGRAEAKRLKLWLGGEESAPRADELSLRPLTAGTAKTALAQLSRLVVTLGAKGSLFVLTDAESIVDLATARRDVALTVLRELVDNADGHRGMIASRLVVLGAPGLVLRKHALSSHEALATRLLSADADVLTPHAGLAYVDAPEENAEPLAITPTAPEPRRANALRSMLRLAQGLPPLEATPELTVGLDAVDTRIDALFQTAQSGSVFAVLSGEYGAGKTHHLLHLEARALAAKRPVLRLSVERLDEDLGNPQRHLRRLLESSVLPLKGRPGPLDRLDAWLAGPASEKKLLTALVAIRDLGNEASSAAERALRSSSDGALGHEAVLETLSAIDLTDKPAGASYRKDAYARLHLWLELLTRIDGCAGPVVLLDEAENLYRPGVSRPERRTALRSLAFYCGGSLAQACVVLAVTPDTLTSLREEASELLDEIEEQRTLLPSEDVAMLRRRLVKAKPLEVQRLTKAELAELAEQARKLYVSVRGRTPDPELDAFVKKEIAGGPSPRALLRRTIARLERIHFSR
jgi:hypothetical protein